MQVHIQNDGPVTIQLETPNFPPPKEVQTKSCSLHPIPFPSIIPHAPHSPLPSFLAAKAPKPSKEEGHGEQ